MPAPARPAEGPPLTGGPPPASAAAAGAPGHSARLVIRPEALAEVREAAGRYEREAPGLGGEFLAEVQRAFGVVRARPAAGAPRPNGRRQVLLRRFPYAVVYRELPGALIRVLAVAHGRRRPGYWAGRDRP